MSLRLYDTATRTVRDFVPLQPGRVSIYLCGATVQAPPHIGHIRSGLNFDVAQRWLAYRGYEVTFIRNVTDIDDKIIARAADEGVPYWLIAMRNERAFTAAYDVLGCLPPAYEPRATGHVPEMISLMHRLIDDGHAYAAGGDVYFDVRAWPSYGALSGQRIDEMLPAADSDLPGKRDPRDFALWKASRPGEPSWDTPWGPGRPGWHLECSAMAHKYNGPAFDIHGGGLDLVFPHHENEIAQSQAAGDGFARWWLHNAWVTTSGEKMSKSLGNSLLVSEVVQRVRPVQLRYYLVAAHYRSMIEFSEEALAEAGVAYARIEGFVRHAIERVGAPRTTVPTASPQGFAAATPTAIPPAFAAGMDDDLGVPQALAVLHDTIRAGNSALAAGDDTATATALGEVLAMTGILGLDPTDSHWSQASAGDQALRGAVDGLVAVALDQRTQARDRRDYAAADAVRDGLRDAGIAVEDTPAGPRWTLAGRP